MSIVINGLTKSYNNNKVVALNEFSYKFDKNKMYAIMGPSGSGKSTLLNILGSLDKPTKGQVFVEDTDICNMKEKDINKYRIEKIGFVFQSYYLNPYFNAIDNVIVPMCINESIKRKERKSIAYKLLEDFKVEHLKNNFPYEMSGGEQQRICLARAMANHPEIILADEPTGNLDEENERIVFEYLKEIARNNKIVIVVSHNDLVKEYADEVIYIKKGKHIKEQ